MCVIQPEIQLKPFPRTAKIPFAQLYPKIEPLAIDLLEKLLQFDPARRLTCEEALQHPYFQSPQAATMNSHASNSQYELQQQQQAQQQAQQQQQYHSGRGY